jgi:hypothetical protein
MADLTTQYPTSPEFQSVNFKLVTPSQITETNSGKVRRTGYGVSYYTWEVQYSTLTPVEAGTIQGYLAQTFGPQLSFEIVLPEISYTKSTNAPSTRVRVVTADAPNGFTNTIGVKQIKLENCGSSKRVLAAGDFFKFSGHSKVYMCVSPCDSDFAGNATLYFSGSLTNNVDTVLKSTGISGTTLTTTGLDSSYVGKSITGSGVVNGTYITAVTNSTTATVSQSQTVVSTMVTYHESLTLTAVPFTAILSEDVQEWSVGYGGLTTLKIGMRENW